MVANLGAAVTVQGAACADALVHCLQRQQQTAALLVQACDQPEVVAGAELVTRRWAHGGRRPRGRLR